MPDIANVAPFLQPRLEGYPFFAEMELDEDEKDRTFRLALEARARGVLKDDLTRQIDHILYTEWDPIGVHSLDDFDCYDEYHRYLPTIVEMLCEDATLKELSDQLMEYEGYIFGDWFGELGCLRRRCDVIAVMVTRYGPHAAQHPFVVTIDTDTPEAAYQSVLDLVTQTRIDAYEAKWEAVCRGYKQAVQICQTFLSGRCELVGVCLNNLGHAHTRLGQFDQARAALEQAARKLQPERCTGRMPKYRGSKYEMYKLCLKNLMVHLAHRGERIAMVRYARALVAYEIRRSGDIQEARALLHHLVMSGSGSIPMQCARLSVEHDKCGVIGQVVMIE